MASLLYMSTGLKNSPYHSYLGPELWDEIEEEYIKSSCKLMGLSVECPLNIWLEFFNNNYYYYICFKVFIFKCKIGMQSITRIN
jgi:hypothetical protein